MLMRSIAWSSLKAWGVRLMKTKGRRRAIVAVARKIAVLLHRMWIDGTEFQFGSEAAACTKKVKNSDPGRIAPCGRRDG